MNSKKNIASALFLQFVTIISGLILPKLIINAFGSEINGLVSSITQFLGFISLIEGGLGAVVLAELYKPIEQNDDKRINEILAECQNFFIKLSIIFIIYTLILSILYPLICGTKLSFLYVNTLIIILSISTLIKYLFSITYKLYLQANQKIYIVNYLSTLIIIFNLVLVFLVLNIFPKIHLVKLVGDFLFLFQPIIFKFFVDKKNHVEFKISKANKSVLKNRWSGFAQNFAHFVNMNTDIVVITLFVGLKEVSVYSVYMLAIIALRSFISLISNSYQSDLGKYYAQNNIDVLKKKFLKLEKINWLLSIILYSTCFLLINDFVKLYTVGIDDANYFQPLFASIIIIATMIYSICEPKNYLILSAGKFKEIKKGYIIEALINIVFSVILSFRYGIVGVAIGTLIAVIYKFIYFIRFLKKNIVYVKYRFYAIPIIIMIIIVLINLFISMNITFKINAFFDFVVYGVVVVLFESFLSLFSFGIIEILKLIKFKLKIKKSILN